LIRRWFAKEKRFCIWITNWSREAWPAERVMCLYRCRWQVELLFKEWKFKGFVTGPKAIAEGLVWTCLLSLVLKQRVAQSLIKEGVIHAEGCEKWCDVVAADIGGKAYRTISEIRERLEWAVDFLSKNARRTKP
jgi:hypothetical protein